MRFDQPWLLVAALVGPALVAAYVWRLRRGRRTSVRFSSVDLVREAAAGQRAWRRHIPVGLVVGALILLGIGAARPQVKAMMPVTNATVILTLDVSGSMCSTDVAPNRLAAAQEAVRTFVKAQKTDTKIGLVVFSGFAQLAVAPTHDKAELLKAVDGLTTGRGTVIGAAILKSIDTVAEVNEAVKPSDPDDGMTKKTPPASPAEAVPEIVVLLTDGANTRGVTPPQAAIQAAERGIRIYPIGFGTKTPGRMSCLSSQVPGGMGEGGPGGPGGFGGGGGGGGGGGRGTLLPVDEEALEQVAKITGGEYHAAADAEQLNKILADVPTSFRSVEQTVDLSAGFAVLGSLLLVGAAMLQLRRPLGP